ncbi:MAG TPA: hypothetical protein VKG91_12650 [Roseiarcus sp.]|nr:hypothetical protein [Roseiarcus sp.]
MTGSPGFAASGAEGGTLAAGAEGVAGGWAPGATGAGAPCV